MEPELKFEKALEKLEKIVTEASTMIEREGLQDAPAIVLLGDTWAMGLIGLAAARIVERYHRPTLLLGKHADGIAKGSGRSIEAFNLLAGIEAQSELLVAYGGHEKAAGLQLKESDLPEFRKRFIDFAASQLTDDDLVPTIKVDTQITADEITDEFVTEILRFRPFGPSNPRPKFVVTPLTIADIRTVGADNSHLNLRFVENNLDAIGFRRGEFATQFKPGDEVAALGTLEFNEYNGTQRIQLKLDDLKSETETEQV